MNSRHGGLPAGRVLPLEARMCVGLNEIGKEQALKGAWGGGMCKGPVLGGSLARKRFPQVERRGLREQRVSKARGGLEPGHPGHQGTWGTGP